MWMSMWSSICRLFMFGSGSVLHSRIALSNARSELLSPVSALRNEVISLNKLFFNQAVEAARINMLI